MSIKKNLQKASTATRLPFPQLFKTQNIVNLSSPARSWLRPLLFLTAALSAQMLLACKEAQPELKQIEIDSLSNQCALKPVEFLSGHEFLKAAAISNHKISRSNFAKEINISQSELFYIDPVSHSKIFVSSPVIQFNAYTAATTDELRYKFDAINYFPAKTKWRVKRNLWPKEIITEFGAKSKPTELYLSFEIQLPWWSDYEHAESDDKERWKTYFCNLAKHELEHVSLTLHKMSDAAKNHPSKNESKIKYWKSVYLEIRQIQKNYDEETSHGPRL